MRWPGFAILRNEAPQAGLSYSIRLGIRAAREGGADAVLIALADMPLVPLDHYSRMIQRYQGPDSLIASSNGQDPMPPALFGRSWFERLETLQGDRGARALLRRADLVTASASELLDVDTPSQLRQIIGALRSR